jgi:NTP pyrophosphatase (non-canonical NTP hydrolase)
MSEEPKDLIGFPTKEFQDYIEFIRGLNRSSYDGEFNAYIMAVEECAEFQKVCTKILRSRNKYEDRLGSDRVLRKNLVEELADLLFTASTIAVINGITQEELNEVIISKSKRYGYNGFDGGNDDEN